MLTHATGGVSPVSSTTMLAVVEIGASPGWRHTVLRRGAPSGGGALT